MATDDINQYLVIGKNALDIAKGLIGLLPKGPESEKAASEILRAEEALTTSEAQLAKALGYRLCQCTFPPQIMLWREDQEAHICPRPECGHALTPTQVRRSDQGGSWNRARRGR